jgi:hypothetical protein
MSTTYNLDTNILGDGEQFVAYDYYEMPFSSGEASFYDETDKNRKIIMHSGVNPSLVFKNTDWKVTELIVSGSLHNVGSEETPTGELIIVHTANSNSDFKLALCVPLIIVNTEEPSNTTNNDLYKLFEVMSSDSTDVATNISLNSLIGSEKMVHYSGASSAAVADAKPYEVLVYSKPFTVGKKDIGFLDNLNNLNNIAVPFTPNTDYSIIPSSSVSSISADNIYIDCSPTGESKETIATYNVPINSEYTENASKLQFANTTMQSVYFVLMLSVAYLVVPQAFKSFGVNKNIEQLFSLAENKSNDLVVLNAEDFNKRVNITIDGDDKIEPTTTFFAEWNTYGTLMYFIIFGLVAILIPLMAMGMILNNINITSMSIYLSIFIFLSVASIFLKLSDNEYATYKYGEKKYTMFYYDKDNVKSLAVAGRMGMLDYFMKGLEIFKNTWKETYGDVFKGTDNIMSIAALVALIGITAGFTASDKNSPLFKGVGVSKEADKAGIGVYFFFAVGSTIGGIYKFLKTININF